MPDPAPRRAPAVPMSTPDLRRTLPAPSLPSRPARSGRD
jgi:hypothetical protein